MSTDTDDAGFLSRWSRRKALVRQGASPPEPAAVAPPPAPPAPPAGATAQAMAAGTGQGPAQPAAVPPVPTVPELPPPTLDDVAALDRHSDFSRFVGRDVRPEVRNAALGKLFSDPHFNIMDGLDTYIDDYGKPDPLPQSMLRKMAQARALGLFDDDRPTTAPTGQPAAAAPAPPEPAANEDTDLQLQPDDGPGCTGAEPGPGEDAGRAH
jgi:hypothetical protein